MKAKITLTARINPIMPGYRPSFRVGLAQSDCQLTEFERIAPGESGEVEIELLHPEKFDLKVGDTFILTEGLRKTANGIII